MRSFSSSLALVALLVLVCSAVIAVANQQQQSDNNGDAHVETPVIHVGKTNGAGKTTLKKPNTNAAEATTDSVPAVKENAVSVNETPANEHQHHTETHNQADQSHTDVDALFQQYLKLERQVAELEATAPHAETVAKGEATSSTTTTNTKTSKAQRKLEEKRLQLANLKQNLINLGVDVDAKVREHKEQVEYEANEKALNGEFTQHWIAKLKAEGRTELAEQEAAKAAGLKQHKRFTSPTEKSQSKIDKLKLKLEREQYRLEWIAQHSQKQADSAAANASGNAAHSAWIIKKGRKHRKAPKVLERVKNVGGNGRLSSNGTNSNNTKGKKLKTKEVHKKAIQALRVKSLPLTRPVILLPSPNSRKINKKPQHRF